MGFEADCRAAAVAFLADYASSASIKLQVYPGRPASLHPPVGFVDRIAEALDHSTRLTARNVTAEMVVLHGIFDSADTVAQRDAFVDGLIDWSEGRYHATGANTICALDRVDDDPIFVPDWVRPELRVTYYATRISLGGFRRG